MTNAHRETPTMGQASSGHARTPPPRLLDEAAVWVTLEAVCRSRRCRRRLRRRRRRSAMTASTTAASAGRVDRSSRRQRLRRHGRHRCERPPSSRAPRRARRARHRARRARGRERCRRCDRRRLPGGLLVRDARRLRRSHTRRGTDQAPRVRSTRRAEGAAIVLGESGGLAQVSFSILHGEGDVRSDLGIEHTYNAFSKTLT